MRTHRLVLPLLMGALTAVGMLVMLSQVSQVAADEPQGWNGNWYWKDGGWTDYAPSGVPDFDQKQGPWQKSPGKWSYCGPVAAANSVWWFDSVFEPYPQPPPTVNDNYYLVTPYGAHDDHDPQNVGGMGTYGLVDHLACYFDTDGQTSLTPITGTEVHTMSYGLQWYLYNHSTHPCYDLMHRGYAGSHYDDYHVQLVKKPTWNWVVEEVERSEDVILLLGFWEYDGGWKRLGGHYVTVAGINATDLQIAFSDPFRDNAEIGGQGRALDGSLITPHPHGPHPANMHNDAGNVSHDVYPVTLEVKSPAGAWEIVGYSVDIGNFLKQNVPVEYLDDQAPPDTTPIKVEVEYAIAMSPFYWKPGGEWLHTWWGGEWIWEWWWYEDDGDSCLPDFWWGLDASWDAYDGPVAVANSLWWFDSKAETLVTGGWPKPPPTVSDHYDLVTAHGSWDDHATSNTAPLIKELAKEYLNTNTTGKGTSRADMVAGIGSYLDAQGVAGGFYTKTQEAPSFGWVADEVYMSEDVIVLLGFYEYSGGSWERKGGHWVNLAGANRSSQLVGLSDPTIDNAITPSYSDTLHLGRVFPPEHQGTDFTKEEKKAPQSISHDIYKVTTVGVPAGAHWALPDYPVTNVLTDFIGLNGGGTAVDNWGNTFATVAEWAIGVSPHSDLVITATVVPTETVPGGNVIIILQYANHGLAAANSVTITHVLAGNLTNPNYVTFPPLTAIPGATYGWTLPKLSYGQGGTITLTAKVGGSGTVIHTARITGTNSIGGPTPDGNPANNVAGYSHGLHLPAIMKD